MTYPDAAKMYAYEHPFESNASHKIGCLCVVCEDQCRTFDAGHDAALASARQPERVLTTAAELRALPKKQAFAGEYGGVYRAEGDDLFHGLSGRHYTSVELAAGGKFTPLIPAAAVPAEPERLTDPDDPRIQPGARVRLTIDYDVVAENGAAYQYEESWLRARIRKPTVATTPDHERWYLLAEAPDPDADRVAEVLRWLDETGEATSIEDQARHLLARLDALRADA